MGINRKSLRNLKFQDPGHMKVRKRLLLRLLHLELERNLTQVMTERNQKCLDLHSILQGEKLIPMGLALGSLLK